MRFLTFIPRRTAGFCALALIAINLGGAVWSFFFLHFIAYNVGVAVGLAYAVASGVVLFFLALRLDLGAAVSFVNALAIGGIFGFFAASQTTASLYTNFFGVSVENKYSVSASYYAPGGRYRSCYQQYLSGVLWLAVSGDLLCTESSIPVGSILVVRGPSSFLGQSVEHLYVASRP